MLIIKPFPETHLYRLTQTIGFRIGEPQEDLIGRAAEKQFIALLRQCFTDAVGLKHGVTAELKAKLSVLEAELIRLRKDRREMEKYLLDKIKAMTT